MDGESLLSDDLDLAGVTVIGVVVAQYLRSGEVLKALRYRVGVLQGGGAGGVVNT